MGAVLFEQATRQNHIRGVERLSKLRSEMSIKTVLLPNGEKVLATGQGTWMIGERRDTRAAEIAALRTGVGLGMTLIDTAELYGDDDAEAQVGVALGAVRDELFLVSKAYPHNASLKRLSAAREASLKRLGTDRLDLYLLHWRGSVPPDETVEAMERLPKAGKIRDWGISDLDTGEMAELVAAGGSARTTDHILYNLSRRGAEYDLLRWLEDHAMPVMAYSPVEQSRLVADSASVGVANSVDATPAHGHSRGRLKPLLHQFDVGVDARGYAPITLASLTTKRAEAR